MNKRTDSNKKVTIWLEKKTKLRLARFGNLLSSWENVINELLDHVEKCDKYWGERN